MLVEIICTSEEKFGLLSIDKMGLGRNTTVGVKGKASSAVIAVLHYTSFYGLRIAQ
jgi:hypothetical protein